MSTSDNAEAPIIRYPLSKSLLAGLVALSANLNVHIDCDTTEHGEHGQHSMINKDCAVWKMSRILFLWPCYRYAILSTILWKWQPVVVAINIVASFRKSGLRTNTTNSQCLKYL